ncbi:dnaJ1 protein [Firmicutes bacterium CAG:170]|nr:dnaJ1 protein [Firmicutes bacterium CAG:170]
MVIMTAKVSKSKLIAISLLIFVAVILLVLGLSSSARKQAALPENGAQEAPAVPSEIKTNDDRVAYLGSFGWEVCEEPKQTQEVRIPTEPSEVFERYNDLQISQGFDLHEYSGKSVKRYVYEITNYPNSEDTYYATLLIYKNAVIGGDVCSSAQGGTMHSLNMPK